MPHPSFASHPADCLKHLLDPKVGDKAVHQRLLASSVVSFRNTEGKPVLNSKPNIPSAILYYTGVDDKSQYAYMKVTSHKTNGMDALQLRVPAADMR